MHYLVINGNIFTMAMYELFTHSFLSSFLSFLPFLPSFPSFLNCGLLFALLVFCESVKHRPCLRNNSKPLKHVLYYKLCYGLHVLQLYTCTYNSYNSNCLQVLIIVQLLFNKLCCFYYTYYSKVQVTQIIQTSVTWE